jgi:hypothetical protein
MHQIIGLPYGSWEFLDPTLPDKDVRKTGNRSQKVSGDGKAKAISSCDVEYGLAMKGLREVTTEIFNSLDWEHKMELRGVNGRGFLDTCSLFW